MRHKGRNPNKEEKKEAIKKENGRDVRKDEKGEGRKTQRGRRMKEKTRKVDVKHGKERR